MKSLVVELNRKAGSIKLDKEKWAITGLVHNILCTDRR